MGEGWVGVEGCEVVVGWDLGGGIVWVFEGVVGVGVVGGEDVCVESFSVGRGRFWRCVEGEEVVVEEFIYGFEG